MNKLSELFDSGTTKVSSNSITSVAKICALLFKAQLESHISHILQKDKMLSTHKALEEFYTSIDGEVDTLMETSMGLYPITGLNVPQATQIQNPIVYFEGLYKEVESLRKGVKETFLQNQIDTIQQLVAHTLYRLKHIQD